MPFAPTIDMDATLAAATPSVDLSALAPPDMTGHLLHAANEAMRAGNLARAFALGWHGYCAAGGSRYDAPLLMSAILDQLRGGEVQQLELAKESLALLETGAGWLNGALALTRLFRWPEAYTWAERSRLLYSEAGEDGAAALMQLADISHRMGRSEDAIALFETAANLHGNRGGYADCKLSAACLYAARGEWAKAWEGWALRFEHYRSHDSLLLKVPHVAPDSDLVGKRVLVYLEQGLGDQIQFSLLVPAWRAVERIGHLTIACGRPLMTLLAPLADAVVCDRDVDPSQYDAIVPVMDLARWRWDRECDPLMSGAMSSGFRWPAGIVMLEPQGFPCAVPPLVGDKYRIGVIWQGNPKHPNDWARSYSVESFSALEDELSDLPVEFVSLQPHLGRPGEMSTAWPGLQDWREYLGDLNQAAHHLAHVHTVVTIDSAYAHLCGACGKRAYLVHGWPKEWRWTAAPDLYESLVHVEQDLPGDQLSAIRKVADMIRAEVAEWRR